MNLIINLSFAYHSLEAIYTLVLGVGSPLLSKYLARRISIAVSSLALPKFENRAPATDSSVVIRGFGALYNTRNVV